jgi:site-specific DNA recombinase
VSSDIQREAGTIESQIDYAREYCRLHKLSILETYKDDGVSGTIKVGERPEGSRMLADARIGKFDTVLVFRIDRLARRTSDLLNTVELLEECGVALRSMTEPFDTSSATGKFDFNARQHCRTGATTLRNVHDPNGTLTRRPI